MTATVTVVSPAGSTGATVELPAEIFEAKVNVPLIHQVVVAHEAASRQGTHATKTRGDVRGGGRKPYRQKGTGRARQGSVRAPQFTGGGIVHGPVSRSHAVRTPKKMKAAALRGALSDRARHGLVQVVDGFVDGDSPKTGHAVSVLAAVTGLPAGSASVLVVADRSDQLTWKSLRNARGVHVIDPGQLNSYDVLVRDRVVFTKPAFESFIVAPHATKTQIRQAVEAIFNVKVTGVNTLNRPGKRRRIRTKTGQFWGRRPDTKRAIVSLAAGERIDIGGQG